MGHRLDWLFERPIAHRGLHDRSIGVIENTPSAVARAIEHGFAVEIDVQPTRDGEAVVFHDATLDRLTEASGPVSARTLAELKTIAFRETSDRIWTLDDCLDMTGGESPIVVEVKSSFSGDMRLAARVAERIAARPAMVAPKSFDPRVLREFRRRAPQLPRGIIGEAFADDDPYWAGLTRAQRFGARNLLHWPWTRPDFVSWSVHDLQRRSVTAARALGKPVMSWTVRTPQDQARAALYADQIVFEGFVP